jgi:hypothetical protein
MSPTPNGALLSGDGRRPSTYCQTPPLGQSNSGQLLPPQLAGALSRKLHRNTTQPHDPMVCLRALLPSTAAPASGDSLCARCPTAAHHHSHIMCMQACLITPGITRR